MFCAKNAQIKQNHIQHTHINAIYPFNDLIYEHLVDVDALSKLKNLRTNEHHKSTLTFT